MRKGVNIGGLKRLKEYIMLCNQKKVLTFQYKLPDTKKYTLFKNIKFQKYLEYEYTKMDLFDYLIKKERSKIINSEQIMSGIIFLKKSNFSLSLIHDWERVLKKDNLIDDSKSISKNHGKFIEHRHDQSAFSLICKKKNIYSISSAECEWAEKQNMRTWQHLKYFPIHSKEHPRCH